MEGMFNLVIVESPFLFQTYVWIWMADMGANPQPATVLVSRPQWPAAPGKVLLLSGSQGPCGISLVEDLWSPRYCHSRGLPFHVDLAISALPNPEKPNFSSFEATCTPFSLSLIILQVALENSQSSKEEERWWTVETALCLQKEMEEMESRH